VKCEGSELADLPGDHQGDDPQVHPQEDCHIPAVSLDQVPFPTIYAIISISSLCNAKDIFQFIISSITPFGVIISLYAIMKK